VLFRSPANWRRPESKLYPEMAVKNQLSFLHILGERETSNVFDVGSRVDLYVIKKKTSDENSQIIDETGKLTTIDAKNFPFLPNYAYESIRNIITQPDSGIRVIFSSSIYEHRRPHIRKEKDATFKFPVVHSITQAGLGFLYTNDSTKGHFGQPKVLLNVGRNQYPYNDYEGKYGMSQIVFGIPITTKEEGDAIVKAINSDAFKQVIKATKWGTFQTDYRMFKYFRPDFYKEFL
jgi:hypothetical protein